MALYFKPVTLENRIQIEQISLFPHQVNYVESTKECLEEADTQSRWQTVGIYDENMLVGFAMYGCFQESERDSQVWLDRFMIDKNQQGKGYGEAAIKLLLKRLFNEYQKNEVYLSVYADNIAAIHLYEKIGFHFTGQQDVNGEQVMVYQF